MMLASFFCVIGGKKIQEQLGEMDFFMMNKEYHFVIEKTPIEDCILQFDYDNPHEIVGQVLYDNEENKIIVSDILEESEEYIRLYFESTGNYDIFKDKGIFISPVIAYIDEKNIWRIEESLIEIDPESNYKCKFSSKTCKYEGFTNHFSVDIIPQDHYAQKQFDDQDSRMVKLTFCELWKMEWKKD